MTVQRYLIVDSALLWIVCRCCSCCFYYYYYYINHFVNDLYILDVTVPTARFTVECPTSFLAYSTEHSPS